MAKIDSDPTGKQAQAYYKELEDKERKNPKKRSTTIMIKTMKRGST